MTTEDKNIFSPTSEENKQENTPNTPALPQEIADLVGVGKKYATVDDALKSVPHAQGHIKTLEEELQAVKVELAKRRTAEELLEEIKSGITSSEKPSSSSVTPDSVSQLVTQALQVEKAKEVSKNNVGQVSSAFTKKFGDKAEEIYNAIAAENGLTVPMLNRLASTSPLAVLRLAGLTVEKKDTPFGKISSDTNTSALNQNGTVDTSQLTSRVKQGASTKELVNAWKVAGQKVGKPS